VNGYSTKTRILLLLISAGINLILILLIGYRTPDAFPSAEATALQDRTSPPVAARMDEIQTSSHAEPFSWDQFKDPDFSLYVENLRAAGCPEETVRAILFHEIEKFFAARRAAIPVEDTFWAAPEDKKKSKESRTRFEQQLDLEQRLLVQQLFGMDWQGSAFRGRGNNQMLFLEFLAFLPLEKARELAFLVQELENWREQFQTETDGLVLPSDRARQSAYLEEIKGRLEQVLTPDELEELQLRAWTGDLLDVWSIEAQVGNTLPAHEVRELVRIKYQGRDLLEEMFLDFDHEKPSPEEQARQDEQIRALLGESRYEGYLRAKNFEFRWDARTVADAGLPIEKAWDLFDVRKIAQAEAEQAKLNPLVSPTQRVQILREIRFETERALTDLLGAAAAEKLLSQRGYWTQELDKP
jgi:hypothetical protein